MPSRSKTENVSNPMLILGAAILERAVLDVQSANRDFAADARAWLQSDTPGVRMWCAVCGVAPERVLRMAPQYHPSGQGKKVNEGEE